MQPNTTPQEVVPARKRFGWAKPAPYQFGYIMGWCQFLSIISVLVVSWMFGPQLRALLTLENILHYGPMVLALLCVGFGLCIGFAIGHQLALGKTNKAIGETDKVSPLPKELQALQLQIHSHVSKGEWAQADALSQKLLEQAESAEPSDD